MTEEQDLKRIQEAAWTSGSPSTACVNSFIAGVKWRDENPKPKNDETEDREIIIRCKLTKKEIETARFLGILKE